MKERFTREMEATDVAHLTEMKLLEQSVEEMKVHAFGAMQFRCIGKLMNIDFFIHTVAMPIIITNSYRSRVQEKRLQKCCASSCPFYSTPKIDMLHAHDCSQEVISSISYMRIHILILTRNIFIKIN